MITNIAAIVLAAGKGTRIQAKTKNKIMYPLAGKPMISYTMDLLKKIGAKPIVVVVGFQKQEVINFLGKSGIIVNQKSLLGTGHAVQVAINKLPKDIEDSIVLYADHSAFYELFMMEDLIKHHRKRKALMTFLTVDKKNPTGYGRILRNNKGNILGIREEKNTSLKERKIKEINTGAYCFKLSFLKNYLPKIKKNPLKGEFYLTDLVELALKDGLKVASIKIKDEIVSIGVNTPEELMHADRLMRKRLKYD